jgi:phosphate transport system permease protein
LREARGIIDLSRRSRPGETAIRAFLFSCAAVSVMTTAGIIFTLGKESFLFFKEVSVAEFLLGRRWQPQIGEFGILSLLTATLMTSFIAMVIALPLGLAVALYLAEYAPEGVRAFLKPLLEILAGIPTVVYGSRTSRPSSNRPSDPTKSTSTTPFPRAW